MDLRILLLISNFAMIYIIHKISVLIKNSMNYFKNKCFFKKYNRLLFKKKKFSQYIMMKNPRLEEEKVIKDIRNLFRLKKEQNDTAIKDIRNLFRI